MMGFILDAKYRNNRKMDESHLSNDELLELIRDPRQQHLAAFD
jgi:hypothetical protein